ncbi:queuosine precursor transporter [Lentilitoribacter sp. Alg239-R112]|uniref:queuosine precursor transporter n=1 Tax=Lentilitoribacter sp. Alg239-R112 TaxID=2305987 RepID=UPI0013A6D7A1|nr:queuosine precursor transporter [Lentilitoribacter sp. Alg239-R112]
MLNVKSISPFIFLMAFIIVASNYLVQFPVNYTISDYNLADLLTWGAFTYPIAFLITDMTNRKFGTKSARIVVAVGFLIAVGLSIWLATPRIAIASGSAFLIAQLLDVSIFNSLRKSTWWHAPLISSIIGSIIDTVLFFAIAFSAGFGFLGFEDTFVLENAPLLGLFAMEAPRWISWAMGDLGVKLIVGLVMLIPYGAALPYLTGGKTTAAA